MFPFAFVLFIHISFDLLQWRMKHILPFALVVSLPDSTNSDNLQCHQKYDRTSSCTKNVDWGTQTPYHLYISHIIIFNVCRTLTNRSVTQCFFIQTSIVGWFFYSNPAVTYLKQVFRSNNHNIPLKIYKYSSTPCISILLLAINNNIQMLVNQYLDNLQNRN